MQQITYSTDSAILQVLQVVCMICLKFSASMRNSLGKILPYNAGMQTKFQMSDIAV